MFLSLNGKFVQVDYIHCTHTFIEAILLELMIETSKFLSFFRKKKKKKIIKMK